MTRAQYVVLPRIVGFEREHGLVDLSAAHELFPFVTEANLRTVQHAAHQRMLLEVDGSDPIHRARGWLPNGGCTYVDMNQFVEYASPECRSARQLVAHHSAAHCVMEPIWSKLDGRRRYKLIANNICDKQLGDGLRTARDATYGYHENYLCRAHVIPKQVDTDTLLLWQPMLAFLATRQILDGAGVYMNARDDTYAFSQRAGFMIVEMASSSTQKRPLILTRDEPHMTSPAGAWRFQLILGDSNVLEWPVFLRFGLTSLVLAMMENGATDAFPRLKNPVAANQALAKRSDPAVKDLELQSGELVSALDIQIRCVAAIKAFVARAGFECLDDKAEAEEVIRKAQETLEHLRARNIPWLVGRLDYITKRAVINAALAREGRTDNEDRAVQLRRSLEMSYHDFADDALGARIRTRWPERHIVSDSAVVSAASRHEGNTRAATRGAIVRRCIGLGLKPSVTMAAADWSVVTLARLHRADEPEGLPTRYSVPMSDPFETGHRLPPWPEFTGPL